MSNFLDDSIRDKVVIITGGSRGFGWFIAEKLLECGAYVTITASSESNELEEALKKAEVIAGKDKCIAVKADVRKWVDCQRTVKLSLEKFGKIDVLINNAGRGSREYRIDINKMTTRFWEVPNEAWHSVIDTNLTGTFLMTKATVPQMIKQKSGKIFSISTSLTTMIGNSLSPYGASKAGIETAHIVWSREIADHNIDINILLPGGASDTDFIPQSMVQGEVGTRHNKILPGDIIVPPAIWLCSDKTNGITGRRIIAKFWDKKLKPEEAFNKCLQPSHPHPEIM